MVATSSFKHKQVKNKTKICQFSTDTKHAYIQHTIYEKRSQYIVPWEKTLLHVSRMFNP